ncbi:EF-hand domain-containing protein [Pseudoscourfieldia marina]
MGEVRKELHGVRIADCPPELREKLAQYDTNGNGIIDPNELPDPMSAEMTYLKVSSFPKKVHPLLHEIDDEKNGKIEMDELTEILTVYVDLKKANKEGSIAIKTLPKEIQPTLKVFDVDGDGTVAPMELARGAELYKESKKTTKRLTIFSGVLLVILCALVGVIVGLVAVVVENSKETKTDSKTGITFAKGSSKPSATAKVTKTDSIYNAVKKPASALRAIGSLTLGKPDGSSLMYTVTGAETHGGAPGKANAVAFYSARGDVINVTATSRK